MDGGLVVNWDFSHCAFFALCCSVGRMGGEEQEGSLWNVVVDG